MSFWICLSFFALSLVAYVLCAGADFGVGILELFVPAQKRGVLRRLGEGAIAPVWEANHIWIIIALVILFVGFPAIHVRLATDLHIPLLLMLAGIILRGTAFTFRYYDLAQDPGSQRLWSLLFRGGSVLVPLTFGCIVAATASGQLQPVAQDFAASYLRPWLGAFPLATGLFTMLLFAWIAAVFLAGECNKDQALKDEIVAKARRWSVALLLGGGVVTGLAYRAKVPWLMQGMSSPWTLACVLGSMLSFALVWRWVPGAFVWRTRIAVGAVVVAIMGGFWGAEFPTALQIAEPGPSLTWMASAAPSSVLDGLAVALLVAALTVLPSLFYLYRLFKRSSQT